VLDKRRLQSAVSERVKRGHREVRERGRENTCHAQMKAWGRIPIGEGADAE